MKTKANQKSMSLHQKQPAALNPSESHLLPPRPSVPNNYTAFHRRIHQNGCDSPSSRLLLPSYFSAPSLPPSAALSQCSQSLISPSSLNPRSALPITPSLFLLSLPPPAPKGCTQKQLSSPVSMVEHNSQQNPAISRKCPESGEFPRECRR